jgi:hypothetical protein
LPQGGPTGYTPPKAENPEVPLKVAGSGEMNLQGQREEPQGGPSDDNAYNDINESMPSFKDIINKFNN